MGTHYTYVGTKDGKKAVDKVVVSDKTRVIDGAECRLIEDTLYLDGVLEERTTDYYTQGADGAVWYYGEDTAELDAQGAVTSSTAHVRTIRVAMNGCPQRQIKRQLSNQHSSSRCRRAPNSLSDLISRSDFSENRGPSSPACPLGN